MLRDVLGALLFQIGVLLLPVLLIGYPVLVWLLFFKRRPAPGAARAGLSAALVAFPLALVLLGWRILHDRSSTAGIALYVAPLLAAVAAVLVFLLAWSLTVLWQARRGERRRGRLALALLALVAVGLATSLAVRAGALRRRASDPGASAQELSAIFSRPAAQNDPAVLAALAANPASPPELLRRLAGSPSAKVLLALAERPRVPPDVLARLATSREVGVRAAVAIHPSTPVEALDRLAADPESPVRLAVAANRGTPSQSLAKLARDQDAGTRAFVATNPHTPRSALEELAQDRDEKVRHYASQALAARRD